MDDRLLELRALVSTHGSVWFFAADDWSASETVTVAVDARLGELLADALSEPDELPLIISAESWQIRSREPLTL